MGTPNQTWFETPPEALTGGILRSRTQIYFETLIETIEQMSNTVKSKIALIQARQSAMSIGDMFDLQMAMNRLSQFSEMSTSIISAMNTAINSMARNIKG